MSTQNTPAKKSTGRALKSGLDDILYLVAVIAIVVIVNVIISDQGRARIDLTEDGLYSLTEASQGLVADLPANVEVKAFFSEGLQAPEHNLAERVDDILAEYAAHSGGKLTYEVIFPDEDKEEDEETAKGYGIEKIAVGQRDKNQVGLRLVYKGIALVSGDKQEVIKEIKASDNLEYEITKAIKNLFLEKPRKVGVLAGFGGPGGSPQFVPELQRAFQNIYGKLVVAEAVDLSTSTEIADDIDALLILNVQQPLSEGAKFAIDQFVMRGKALGVFQSPTGIDQQMPQLRMRRPILHGMNDLLGAYGLQLRSDLVLDREKAMMGIELTRDGRVAQVTVPSLPLLTGINEESVVTKDIDAIVLPYSGTIELVDAINGSDAVVTKLIETADSAVRRSDVSRTRYEDLREPSDDEEAGPHLVAASVDGVLPSAFADGPPEGIEAPEGGVAVISKPGARLLVVGNGEFLTPQGYGEDVARYGILFFLNTIDWLVQDESLIRIRNKGVPRLLEPVDEDTQFWLQLLNIGGIPAGVALLGLLWWGIRIVRRSRIREIAAS